MKEKVRVSTRKTTRISAKNQVTLPVASLAQAHLRSGATVSIEADGPGRIVVSAVDGELDEFVGALAGIWPAEALEHLRDEWR
jgi:bifunctional DNA-binding transcriptional regulator/antitoxin component of YhaV-PrlF toxin-antitoxin module